MFILVVKLVILTRESRVSDSLLESASSSRWSAICGASVLASFFSLRCHIEYIWLNVSVNFFFFFGKVLVSSLQLLFRQPFRRGGTWCHGNQENGGVTLFYPELRDMPDRKRSQQKADWSICGSRSLGLLLVWVLCFYHHVVNNVKLNCDKKEKKQKGRRQSIIQQQQWSQKQNPMHSAFFDEAHSSALPGLLYHRERDIDGHTPY